MRPTNHRQLKVIQQFIKQHGHPAAIVADKVHFTIPFTINGSMAGTEHFSAGTLSEAKEQLGY